MINTTAYKRIIFLLFSFFCLHTLSAQELSVQIAPGLINYGGDLQGKFYTFQQASLSISGGLMYSINKITIRAGATYGKVKGSDLANGLYKTRNLSFETNISDLNLCLQYDLFNLNEKKFTPYIFAGIGVFHFNPYANYNSEKIYLQPLSTEGEGLSIYPDNKPYALTQVDLPFGIGVRYKFSDRIQLGIEFCSRYLFTDYLDDVSAKYPDGNTLFKERGQTAVDLSYRGNEINPALPYPSGANRGNPGQNDNFYTSTFSFIYVFPKATIFSSGNHKKMRGINCPKVK